MTLHKERTLLNPPALLSAVTPHVIRNPTFQTKWLKHGWTYPSIVFDRFSDHRLLFHELADPIPGKHLLNEVEIRRKAHLHKRVILEDICQILEDQSRGVLAQETIANYYQTFEQNLKYYDSTYDSVEQSEKTKRIADVTTILKHLYSDLLAKINSGKEIMFFMGTMISVTDFQRLNSDEQRKTLRAPKFVKVDFIERAETERFNVDIDSRRYLVRDGELVLDHGSAVSDPVQEKQEEEDREFVRTFKSNKGPFEISKLLLLQVPLSNDLENSVVDSDPAKSKAREALRDEKFQAEKLKREELMKKFTNARQRLELLDSQRKEADKLNAELDERYRNILSDFNNLFAKWEETHRPVELRDGLRDVTVMVFEKFNQILINHFSSNLGRAGMRDKKRKLPDFS